MAARKKQLHQPPHEFAVANKARHGWDWILKRDREAARSERDRARVMPSHPKPDVSNFLSWDESYEHGRQRLANRKANKKFI